MLEELLESMVEVELGITAALDVIEQGPVTLNLSYKAIVALLVSLERQRRTNGQKDEEPC